MSQLAQVEGGQKAGSEFLRVGAKPSAPRAGLRLGSEPAKGQETNPRRVRKARHGEAHGGGRGVYPGTGACGPRGLCCSQETAHPGSPSPPCAEGRGRRHRCPATAPERPRAGYRQGSHSPQPIKSHTLRPKPASSAWLRWPDQGQGRPQATPLH